MSKKQESAKQRQQRVRGKRINKQKDKYMDALDKHMLNERLKSQMKTMQGIRE